MRDDAVKTAAHADGSSHKSLAAEIEARAGKAQAGLARAYELIADQYGTWSPENGTQFSDRGAAEAVEGIRLARELLAEIAAFQSRAFEDGARWMRDQAAEKAGTVHEWIPEECALEPIEAIWEEIRNLPLQPEGERNA